MQPQEVGQTTAGHVAQATDARSATKVAAVEVLEQVDDWIDVDLRRVQQHLAQCGGFTLLGREALDASSFDHGIEGRRSAQISTDVSSPR